MAGLRWPTEAEYRAHGAAPFGNFRAAPVVPLAINETEHTIDMMTSTEEWARDGQQILAEAWRRNLPAYMANPIVTWAHSWWDPPIGLVRDAEVRPGQGLFERIWLDVDDEDILAIWRAVRSTRVRCASMAWDGNMIYSYPNRLGDKNDFGEWVQKPDGELGWQWRDNITAMETALVPIPSDTGANMMLQRSLGIGGPRPAELTGEAREAAAEARVVEDLERLRGATESVRNYYRHIAKDGGAPSPGVIEQVVSPITNLVEIATGHLREGKVLSAANLEKVQAAHDALAALLEAAGAGRSLTPAPLRAGEGNGGEGDDGGGLEGLLTPTRSCLAGMLGGGG
jgi:hypothetical protein